MNIITITKHLLIRWRYSRLQAAIAALTFGLLLVSQSSIATNYSLSQSIYKSLTTAQQYINKNQTDKAVALLENLLSLKNLKRYEIAIINNQLAYQYYEQGKIQKAINAFAKVTQIREVPESLTQSSLYTLAQIQFEAEQYHDAITSLRRWFRIAKHPAAKDYALLAQAYYHTSNHQLVVDNMNKALDILENKDLSPTEQWLVMLQSSYSELGLLESRVNTMKWLIRIYPKKSYLLALSSAYGLLDQRSKQLSILETAYQKGYLTHSSELLTLASLLFSEGAPYKAAKVLEKGLKDQTIQATLRNFKFLASAWIAAQEFKKSIPVLKQAALLSSSGEIDVMVGNSYYNTSQWQLAADAFQQALKKGDINYPDKILLLVGQCYLNMKDFKSAKKIFEKAKQYDEITEKAQNWLSYTTLEEQRYRAYLEFKTRSPK